MGKLPAFQFYPGDWMKDPSLRACSLQARGLWIDMLCLMHESSRRGYLQHCTSVPVTAAQLARMTGCATDEAESLLRELLNAGVCSRTDNEVIYSRRMVRDENKREKCVAAGKLGGNPTLIRGSKGHSKGGANPPPTPSIASSEFAAADEGLTPGEKAAAAWLAKRPEWLPEGKPWITRAECEKLGRLDLSEADVTEAYRVGKDARMTARNPAGIVINALRKAGKRAVLAKMNGGGE